MRKYTNNNLAMAEVSPWDLEPGELAWLERALHAGYDKGRLQDALLSVAKGEADLWRLSGPRTAGVAATRIIPKADFIECDVWLLAGQGLMWQLGNFSVLLREYAKENACTVIHANVLPELVAAYTRALGMRHDMTSMVMEV